MTTYKCSKCSYSSDTKGSVTRHLKNVCNNATMEIFLVKLPCNTCGREFETEKLLGNHMKSCLVKNSELSDLVDEFIKFKENVNETLKKVTGEFDAYKRRTDDKIEKLERIILAKKPSMLNECGDLCQYTEIIKIVPSSKKFIINSFISNGLEEPTIVDATIKGCSGTVFEADISDKEHIEVEGTNYYYNPIGRQKSASKHLTVTFTKFCDKERSNDSKFCDDHY